MDLVHQFEQMQEYVHHKPWCTGQPCSCGLEKRLVLFAQSLAQADAELRAQSEALNNAIKAAIGKPKPVI